MTRRYRYRCTTPAALSCAGDTTFDDPNPDGSCPCICHTEYQDAPEHWQPLALELGDEVPGMVDWMERMDAAEALTEDTP